MVAPQPLSPCGTVVTCVLAPVLYRAAVLPMAAALGIQKKNEGITLLRPWAKNSCKISYERIEISLSQSPSRVPGTICQRMKLVYAQLLFFSSVEMQQFIIKIVNVH